MIEGAANASREAVVPLAVAGPAAGGVRSMSSRASSNPRHEGHR